MEWLEGLSVEFTTPITWKMVLFRLSSALALSCIPAFYSLFFLKRTPGRIPFAFSLIFTGMTAGILAGIIASSVALSLGMVGALSIIRYRAKLPSPGHLMLVFLVMAAGLGIGLEKGAFVWVAVPLILLVWGVHDQLQKLQGDAYILEIDSTEGDQTIGILRSFLPEFTLLQYMAGPDGDSLRVAFRLKKVEEWITIKKYFTGSPGLKWKLEKEEVEDDEG